MTWQEKAEIDWERHRYVIQTKWWCFAHRNVYKIDEKCTQKLLYTSQFLHSTMCKTPPLRFHRRCVDKNRNGNEGAWKRIYEMLTSIRIIVAKGAHDIQIQRVGGCVSIARNQIELHFFELISISRLKCQCVCVCCAHMAWKKDLWAYVDLLAANLTALK